MFVGTRTSRSPRQHSRSIEIKCSIGLLCCSTSSYIQVTFNSTTSCFSFTFAPPYAENTWFGLCLDTHSSSSNRNLNCANDQSRNTGTYCSCPHKILSLSKMNSKPWLLEGASWSNCFGQTTMRHEQLCHIWCMQNSTFCGKKGNVFESCNYNFSLAFNFFKTAVAVQKVYGSTKFNLVSRNRGMKSAPFSET